jgi:UDP-glucose 4-epimerase
VREFCNALGSSDHAVVVWCAGAGVIGSQPDALVRETDALGAVLDALAGHPGVPVFLTSSAGGVHGGRHREHISESSPPTPISDYGENKLRQERLVVEWAGATGSRAVIGRPSTVYGPGQNLAKGQGLVSTLCSSAVTRQPVSVFVPLDTLRNFVYVDDLGRAILAASASSHDLPAGAVTTKLLVSPTSLSIGALIGEARRVCPRPPVVVFGSSPTRSQHGSAMAFRSRVWRHVDAAFETPLPTGIAATFRALQRQAATHGWNT